LSEQKKKVSVAIVARNEEATVGTVVRDVQRYADEVLLVYGNSTDRTREVAADLGASVYRDSGGGKGDGIRKALEVATGDAIVLIDADGSHEPADIPAMTAPILAGQADLILGSRWTGGSDELGGDIGMFVRSTGSSFITLLINYRWGVRLTDVENGFRAISRRAAGAVVLEEKGFAIEQEMVMKCLKQGFKVGEVPTHEYKRRGGASDLAVWKVIHRFAWNLIKNLFW
jgi:glycosyltransferase involved in cell wall biosynthesis